MESGGTEGTSGFLHTFATGSGVSLYTQIWLFLGS